MPIQTRHIDVGENQLGRAFPEEPRAPCAVERLLDLVAHPDEHVFYGRADFLLIMDHKNAGHGWPPRRSADASSGGCGRARWSCPFEGFDEFVVVNGLTEHREHAPARYGREQIRPRAGNGYDRRI